MYGTAVQGKPLSPVKEEREEEDHTMIIVFSRTCRLHWLLFKINFAWLVGISPKRRPGVSDS